MIYNLDILTPPETFATEPLKTIMPVTNGLIYRVEIYFPPGPYGLLHCWINDGSYQVWPSHDGTAFRGNSLMISFDDLYLKELPPYELSVYTYNLDDTYEHSVMVRIGLVSKDVYLARFLPSIGYEDFLTRMASLSKDQEKARQEANDTTLVQPFSSIPFSGGV